MKRNHRCKKNAVTSFEYALVIAAAILALTTMVVKLKSRVQATHKESIDTIGEGRVGTPGMSGRTRPFVYPVLPAGPGIVPPVVPPIGAGGGDCGALDELIQTAYDRNRAASDRAIEASAARQEATEAAAIWVQAVKAAFDAKQAADAAKDTYDSAQAAADQAQQDCSDCRVSTDDPPPDCVPICDEAARLADVAAQAYDDWQNKLAIQQQKEADRDAKEIIKNQKEALAAKKEGEAVSAATEARATAEALQTAVAACTGISGS